MAEVPSASVAPGLRVRYLGNFVSFWVEEQVTPWAVMSLQRTTLEDLLADDDLAGLKLGVFVKVLTSLKLKDLFRFFTGVLLLLPEGEPVFEIAELILRVLFVSEELVRVLGGLTEDRSFRASEQLVGFM